MKRTESKENVSILEESHMIVINASDDIPSSSINISDDKNIPPSSRGARSIYKVPQSLRQGNEKSYTPTSISIGPFHCNNTNLKSNELKSGYLRKFLDRVGKDVEAEIYVKIRAQEKDIQSSYSEDISFMGSAELVNMILTDACFIIGFFLWLIFPSEKDPNLAKKPWLAEDIKLDLLLLENQLPFFVLEDLFNLAYPTGFKNVDSFFELAFKFFKKELWPEINPNTSSHSLTYYLHRIAHRHLKVSHLNDMLRMLYLPYYLPHRVPHESTPVKPLCTAIQLHEAGITFKSFHGSITELEYSSNGVLTIPCFLVSYRTETIIRNVIALEQCHYKDSCFVTDYFILWDHLINTEKDVEMLVQKGIIKNFMGDNVTVAALFNRLCQNVFPKTCNAEYIEIYEQLNKFYNNPVYRYMAILWREYFSTPWKIASVVAAILLLFLTLIQTICSVVALFKQ